MMPPQFFCKSVLQPYFVACGGMSPPHENMQWQVAAVLTCRTYMCCGKCRLDKNFGAEKREVPQNEICAAERSSRTF